MAEEFRHQREEDGSEALLATLDALNELVAGVENVPIALITEEQYERKFRKVWPKYRPHVNFWNAEPFHQKLIEKIDPEYVEKQRQRKIMAEVSAAKL
jgi:hypothetical protein